MSDIYVHTIKTINKHIYKGYKIVIQSCSLEF